MVPWSPKVDATLGPDLLDKLAEIAVTTLNKTPMQMLRLLEKRIIERALDIYDGNQCKTARFLGLHRNTLLRRMNQRGIRGRRGVDRRRNGERA